MVTEIQQGLPVKQDYTELLVTYSRATGSENYRLLSVAGSGVLPVTEESVPILKGKKPASNPVLTTLVVGYRELPVPECCWFRNRSAAGYKKSTVPILTG